MLTWHTSWGRWKVFFPRKILTRNPLSTSPWSMAGKRVNHRSRLQSLIPRGSIELNSGPPQLSGVWSNVWLNTNLVSFGARALETYVAGNFLYEVHAWRLVSCLGGQLTMKECWASWRRALSPKWHRDTWLLAWSFVLDLRRLVLRSDHVGVVDSKVHMA